MIILGFVELLCKTPVIDPLIWSQDRKDVWIKFGPKLLIYHVLVFVGYAFKKTIVMYSIAVVTGFQRYL